MSRIDAFFENGEYMQHSKMIDFGLFFTMFFALTYLGLTQVWGKGFGKPGEGKGAIVGLSLALSLSLAFAIVTQTQFSITTIFPLAKALFFLIIFFILYSLIVMTKIFGEHWGGKVASAILALMLTYILLSIFTHMVCQMSNNMDDPACESDFFNAIFTLTEGWFDWGGGGGGGGTGGGGAGGGASGGGAAAEGGGEAQEAGPVEGGCRLDLLFEVNSAVIQNPEAVKAFAEKAQKTGAKVLFANGFASREGEKGLNALLAVRRALAVTGLTGMPTLPFGHGAVSLFDRTAYPANRRVVISTESISHFVPAPSPGTAVGCEVNDSEEDKEKLCGNDKKDEGEACDPSVADSCPADQHCEKDCSECSPGAPDEGWNKNWLWLLALLIPFAIWLLIRRKRKKLNEKRVIAMKEHFRKQIERIRAAKLRAWWDLTAADPSIMTDEHVKDKAQEIINMLNGELTTKMQWVDMRTLATRYPNPSDIERQAKEWNDGRIVDDHRQDKHIDLIVKILREMKRRHARNSGVWKTLMKGWDAATFNSKMKEVVTDIVRGNKLTKEAHVFFMLQVKLKKVIEEFAKNEEKVLVQLRETTSKRRFFRFWKKKETEEITREILDAETPADIVAVTQVVRNLCEELLAKIQEVMDEEQNITHHVGGWPELSNPDHTGKFDEELKIISQLLKAIEIQRRRLSEVWEPVIDEINPTDGSMKGHIQYRRIHP
ncbi:hypothetical protein KY359_06150 [Candidatus Woesearchaeota archaeon]|nr:hypothetical protein [Candidatus Woesearchaeota archaeon]